MSTTDDLAGVRMVHIETGTTVVIVDRKTDDSGWWVNGGGGLDDSVIANGSWVPLAMVLACWKATHNGGSGDAG